MAKRKLYGAALAAHQKKRGRSGGGSRALVRRGSSGVVVVRERVAAPVKRKGKGRRRRGGGGGGRTSLMTKGKTALAAMGWGWLKANKPDVAAKIAALPLAQTLGAEVVVGLILHYGQPYIPAGLAREAADHLSAATLTLGGYAYGRSNFASPMVSGADDLSGALDDDVGDYDDVGDDDIGDDDIGDDDIGDDEDDDYDD